MRDTLISTFMKLLPRLLLPLLLLTLTFASIPRHAGAAAAGARELLAPLSQGADPSTQRFVSSLIGITAGAIAGGDRGAEIGYAVALSAEANNRQLHQKEIEWIEKHSGKFAAALYGTAPTREQRADAQARLAQQALRDIDKGWSLKLGSQTDKEAEAFLRTNNEHLFEVKSEAEFYDPTITRYGDSVTRIKDLSPKQKATLSGFYRAYTPDADPTPLKDLYLADLKRRGIQKAEALWEGLRKTPEGIEALYAYLQKTPASQIAADTEAGAQAFVGGIVQTVTDGAYAAGSSGEIARNTGGTADLLNELYRDPTAADAGRYMVDETLFEGVATLGGATKIIGGVGKGLSKLGKLGKGKLASASGAGYAGLESVGKASHNANLHTNINNRKTTLNLPGGYRKNKDGNIITPEGKVLTKGTFTAPSGRVYDHYGREIDLDLEIPGKTNPKTGKPYTNKEWMKKGRNPYVLDENGRSVITNQHHINQNADGPILELEQSKHRQDTQNLHPFGNKKNLNNPVDHIEWDKDRQYINKERIKIYSGGE